MNRKIYKERIKEGICGYCGINPKRENRVSCFRCGKKQRMKFNDFYKKKRKLMGISKKKGHRIKYQKNATKIYFALII